MDFFTHQDQARASTRKLVILFCCAVAALIVMATALIYVVLVYSGYAPPGPIDTNLLFSDIFLKASLGVIAVVTLGSLFRLGQLRGGGKTVAEAMHGRQINLNTRDADERKVLNVVEEMAIASGIPVPPVYLIEDPAINAFAAGYSQDDAVIGVTRGCIVQLDRDELQGVIAHEFSHIFHGDMRLNIRLIGVLYGIMVIGLIGYYMMRGSVYSGGMRSRNRNAGGLVLAGLGLAVIGYGGTFFGNLIKAAVSRQREFLADASAVQYTRNPQGIAGALKKIGGLEAGSRIDSVNVAEYSHMLFEEGVNAGFMGLFATHPPLEERIRRLDPRWTGKGAGKGEGRPAAAAGAEPAGVSGFASAAAAPPSASALDAIGNPSAAHIALARERIADIPQALREQAHSTLGACFLVHALLLDKSDAAVAGRQSEYLRKAYAPAQFAELVRLAAQVADLPRELHLALLELALPSLDFLSPSQYRVFLNEVRALVQEDQKLSLFEWSLYRILRHHLEAARAPRGTLALGAAAKECAVLLDVLAAAGHTDAAARNAAFQTASRYLNEEAGIKVEAAGRAVSLAELEQALERLRLLKPLQKPLLLKAMGKCIHADGKVEASEAELLRAVAAILDCPVPPLLGGQVFS